MPALRTSSDKIGRRFGVALLLLSAALAGSALATPAPRPPDYRARLPQDEVIYFLLPDRFENGDASNDRGGLNGGRLASGFDPADPGFYHGGDLKGVLKHLDYLQGMGVSAIWLAPIFRNKPVQGPPGRQSAGYHGYWITDFTHVDPHFGTDTDFKRLVDAAHARGLKVYMDIVVNHTADVIQYRECVGKADCPYRGIAAYPYQRRGGVGGAAINQRFVGDDVRTAANFTRLTSPDYAYTLFVPADERHIKVPDWLNDPIFYHNRGNSTFAGESSTKGDFSGLDDLMTENPRVLTGMIEIYGGWIDRFGVDGFRIDTARHVDPAFWQGFVPAMLDRAKARGIPNFHIFGEVSTEGLDPATLAEHTRVDKLPSVLDFAFKFALLETIAGHRGTDRWRTLFAADSLYQGGEETARTLPTFSGNHDQGRFATFVRRAFPATGDAEILKRVELANAMLLTFRGVPVIYSGDEQGFVGDGDDRDAREDMFASRVASYNDNRLLGTDATTADSNFSTTHPLYRQIAKLAAIRTATKALRRGRQVLRTSDDHSGLLAISRFDTDTGREVLLAFNTSTQPLTRQIQVEVTSRQFDTLIGDCPVTSNAPGSVRIQLPPLGYAVCAAR